MFYSWVAIHHPKATTCDALPALNAPGYPEGTASTPIVLSQREYGRLESSGMQPLQPIPPSQLL